VPICCRFGTGAPAALIREINNLSCQKQNEAKFSSWDANISGSRVYRLKIAGRFGWTAVYLKEVDSFETTIRFWQEI